MPYSYMNSNIILNYIINDRSYYFRIDDFIFPKHLKTSSNKLIDLELNRNQCLSQGSYWSPNFKKVLVSKFKFLKFHQEFPFIVENLSLWEYLSNKYKIKDKNRINYFLADYFFPDLGLIVEIDSNLHELNYDRARDEYLMRAWGIQILRFFEFGKTIEDTRKYLSKFQKTISSLPKRNFMLNYSESMVNLFYERNKKYISILTTIENNIFNPNTYTFNNSTYKIPISIFNNIEKLIIIDNIADIKYLVYEFFKINIIFYVIY